MIQITSQCPSNAVSISWPHKFKGEAPDTPPALLEDTTITLAFAFHPPTPRWCHPSPFSASVCLLDVLMLYIKQIAEPRPSLPEGVDDLHSPFMHPHYC